MDVKQNIESFIADIFCFDVDKAERLILIQKIILSSCPEAQQEIKYGGLVFNLNSELICGIFIRKNHISVEFGLGYQFKDPQGHLQGSGKFRRHLKIRNDEDVDKKQLGFFVLQAFEVN